MESNFLDNFEKHNIAIIDNGVRLSEFEPSQNQLKQLNIKKKISNYEFLTELCRVGYKLKIKGKVEDENIYAERIKDELNIIKDLGFVDYILMVWDICNFCDQNDIPRGPGRGSVSSSEVCYLIGITKIDSIKYGTYFTRFLSKSRAKYKEINGIKYIDGSLAPDIDLDICYINRYRVKEYLENKYAGKTSNLLTSSTFTSKILIKDILKGYEEFSEEEANKVSGLIEKIHGIPQEINDALSSDPKKENIEFKNWAKNHSDTCDIACINSSLIRAYGKHASALLISHDPINDIMPLQYGKNDDDEDNEEGVISGYDMYSAQELCLKFDLLGLKNVSVIRDICKMIGITEDDIDVNDQSIYDFFQTRDDFYGIFQFESEAQGNVAKKIKPKKFKHIVDALAISRPGASAFLKQYCDYIHDGIHQPIHPLIDPILKETGNVCLFQETLLKMLNTLGMQLDDCEGLRKAIGKKLPEKIKEYKEKIYNVCAQNNHPSEVADLIWKIAEDSGGYQFNLAHSVAYAMISAQTVYLKTNYPKEFFLANLKMTRYEKTNALEKITRIQQEMARLKIDLLPPDLTNSSIDFTIDNNNIRFGLGSIKGISNKTIEKLLSFRRSFNNKFEMFEAALETGINLTVMGALIKAGCLDSVLTKTRSYLLLEFCSYKLLRDREKVLIHKLGGKFNYDLLSIVKFMSENLDENNKKYMKESRFKTFKRDYDIYKNVYRENSKNENFTNYLYEKEVLGYSYSGKLKDIFKENSPALLCVAEAIALDTGKIGTIVAFIKEAEKRTSKKKKKYLSLIIEDESGELKCQFHTGRSKTDILIDIEEENDGNLPKSGDLVFLKYRKGSDNILWGDYCKILDFKVYLKTSEYRKAIEKEAAAQRKNDLEEASNNSEDISNLENDDDQNKIPEESAE